MRKVILLFFILSGTFSFAQQYSKVKIFTDGAGLQRLAELGLPIDHGNYKLNTFFISDFSEYDIQTMKENGYEYEILIKDVQKFYVDQNTLPQESVLKNATCSGTGSGGFVPMIPINFNQGSMGGYLTYQQMLDELDAMAALYPNLITVKAPISTFLTFENRPIYYVRISDNPNANELTETNVLYTAIHHAREPMSMIQTIYYMWYLLENYNSSEEIQYLVNNMQLFFVPCLNPDGYIYNETTNPNGGGMHRKNRRNVGTTNKGVDLNRNYSYGWGTTGISTNPNNDTYCGTGAFSEPETQAMKWMVENYNFTSAFNAHTYGNDILFPIGTTNAEFAPHHNYFQDESDHMTQYNGYNAMKSSGLYPASGDSDDYMYKVDIGVGLKDTIFAHTPEIGSAFWPPISEILPTCQDMVFPNLVLAHITKKYLVIKDTDPNYIATLSGNFNHSYQRLGLEDGAISVTLEPLLNIVSVGSPIVYSIPVRASGNGLFSYSLNPAIQFGDQIKYILKTDNGLWTRRDTITKTYGAITLQVMEDATSSVNWTGTWGTTTATYVSPSKSFTDTPSGNYLNSTNKTYGYNPSIVLTNANAAMITYYAKWDIEADYDYCQFQVSIDGGTTWIGQCTNYTVPGTSASGSVQPNNQPVYEGMQSTWVLDEVDLSDYLGQTIKVRFQLRSDGGQTGDGFYFDDFKILFNENGTVTAPTASFTAVDANICQGSAVTFNDFSSNNPTGWQWNFGDMGISSDQSPVHTYLTPGVYSVELTVTNSAGSDTYQITNYITVYANPVVSVVSSDADNAICIDGGSIGLTASPSGATMSGAGVSGGNFDPLIAGLGSHVVSVNYTDGNGCSGTGQLSILVEDCASIENLSYYGVSIHPNPNNGNFVIKGLEIGSTFKVYDLNGKIILESVVESLVQDIKLDKVRSGIYYLQTIKNGQLGQLKFAVL